MPWAWPCSSADSRHRSQRGSPESSRCVASLDSHSAHSGLPARAAAHAFGCLDDYDSDPEASVTKRVTITATDHGRVA